MSLVAGDAIPTLLLADSLAFAIPVIAVTVGFIAARDQHVAGSFGIQLALPRITHLAMFCRF